MVIRTCDICGTEIDGSALDRDSIQVSVGGGWGVELCKPCAKPVIQFLKRSQLLEVQLARHAFITSPTPHGHAGTNGKPKQREKKPRKPRISSSRH
jgi:hypothetical protein